MPIIRDPGGANTDITSIIATTDDITNEIANQGAVIDDLPAGDQTVRSWLVPASESGTYVKVSSDVIARPSRTKAPLDRTAGFTDFWAPLILNATTNSSLGDGSGLIVQTSGTTAGATGQAIGITQPGVVAITTGTTSATGFACAVLAYPMAFAPAESYIVAFQAKIPTVTTTGQTFDTYLGLRTEWVANAVNDGIYFHAKSGTSAGNWFAVCEDDTTVTEVDTGIAVDTSYHTFVINYNGTDAKFYIDGTLEATISTNIPDSGAALIPGSGIFKTAGTTARTVHLDAMEWDLYHPARGDLMGLLSL